MRRGADPSCTAACDRPRSAQVADDVLDHHHGAVHDHAEIERAQREQIGGNVARSRQMAANSSENGMVMATINAPRMLPRNRNRTSDDENDAFGEILLTVCVVK